MSHHKGEELKLLALVHADLACDEPRLRYADWLERGGRGEEAELIRLQCDPDADAARAAELVARWEPRWRQGLEWISPPGRLDRGFLCVGPNFNMHYDRSEVISGLVRGMLDNRGLYWCQDLYLGYSTSLEAGLAAELADSPYASHISRLQLHEIRLAPGDLVEIARLPGLQILELRGGYSSEWDGSAEYVWPSVSFAELEELVKSPQAGKLKKLIVEHQSMFEDQCKALRAALPAQVDLVVDGASDKMDQNS